MRKPAPHKPHLQGVASVEAVIALPVLILLWAGVLFVGVLVGRQQQTLLTARSCVWQHACKGCGKVGENCHAAAQDDVSAEDGGLQDIKGSVLGKTENHAHRQALDQVLGIFGKATTASSEQSFEQPALLGGKRVTAFHTAGATCNERKREPKDVLLGLIKGVMP